MSSKRLSKKNKTVHRAYGGHLSHAVVRERWVICGRCRIKGFGSFILSCVSHRIIRAFLIEEQKIVKKASVGLLRGLMRSEVAILCIRAACEKQVTWGNAC